MAIASFLGDSAISSLELKKLTTAQEEVSQSLLHRSSRITTQSVDLQKLRSLDEALVKTEGDAAPVSFLQLKNKKDDTAAAEDDMEKEKEALDNDWAKAQKEAAELMGSKKQEIRDRRRKLKIRTLDYNKQYAANEKKAHCPAAAGQGEGQLLRGARGQGAFRHAYCWYQQACTEAQEDPAASPAEADPQWSLPEGQQANR